MTRFQVAALLVKLYLPDVQSRLEHDLMLLMKGGEESITDLEIYRWFVPELNIPPMTGDDDANLGGDRLLVGVCKKIAEVKADILAVQE